MKGILLLLMMLGLGNMLSAQRVYTIQADSVKLTGCDSSELIIENHTQGVPGFLYNTGHGRTVFKHGVVKLNDSLYVIGADTLMVKPASYTSWSLTGNTNIDTVHQFLGTNDNKPVIFHSNGSERMRLFADGDFGINTGSVDNTIYKLQVNGNVLASGGASRIGNLAVVTGYDIASVSHTGFRIDDPIYSSFIFEGSSQGSVTDMFTFTSAYGNLGKDVVSVDGSIVKIQSGFDYANINGLAGNTLSINPTYNLKTPSGYMIFRGIYYNPVLTNLGTGSKHIAIETVSGDVLFGTTSGNVGVGTNSPTAQLHTTGTVRFAGLTSDTTQIRVLVSDTSGKLYYRSASSLAMGNILQSDMATGSTLNSSLAVNGEITAQKLRLRQPDWPDYVFAAGYPLRPLSMVGEYIEKNKHLPGVPSAEEVAGKGVDIGQNQAALLKKIEELTLYVIEEDKKVQSQNEEIRVLQEQNKRMQLLERELAELKKLITDRSEKKKK